MRRAFQPFPWLIFFGGNKGNCPERVMKSYFLLFVRIFKECHKIVTFISASPKETQALTLATI